MNRVLETIASAERQDRRIDFTLAELTPGADASGSLTDAIAFSEQRVENINTCFT